MLLFLYVTLNLNALAFIFYLICEYPLIVTCLVSPISSHTPIPKDVIFY